jgi:hypothetical protein
MWQKYEGEGESDLLTFKRTWELKTGTKRSDEPEVESVRNYFERDGGEKVRDIDLNVSSELRVEWRQWVRQPAGWSKVAQREVGEEARKGREGARRRRGEEKARWGDGEPKLMGFKDKRK